LKDQDIHRVVAILKQEIKRMAGAHCRKWWLEESKDPFSCSYFLHSESSETQDRTTEAGPPAAFLRLPPQPEEMLETLRSLKSKKSNLSGRFLSNENPEYQVHLPDADR